jgi:hypothetical protein
LKLPTRCFPQPQWHPCFPLSHHIIIGRRFFPKKWKEKDPKNEDAENREMMMMIHEQKLSKQV